MTIGYISLIINQSDIYKYIAKEMKLFIAGATGYIGGEVLHQFIQSFPDFEIVALVRTSEKGKLIEDATKGKVKTILGSLDSLNIIREETESSNVIINAASNNHLPSLNVIKDVLSKKKSKTLFMQISGAGVISDSVDPEKYKPNKIYNDIKDIEEINSLPDSQPHRPADKIVLSIEETNPEFIKTVIISPPIIFGFGNGYDNKLSVQIPSLIKSIVKLGKGLTIYKGDTSWSRVHVFDVGTLFITLISKFINNQIFRSGNLGYYFTNEGTDFTWREISVKVTDELFSLNLIKSNSIQELTADEFEEQFKLPALFWGSNARSIAEAGKLTGWKMVKSSNHDFEQDIVNCVKYMKEKNLLK